ncbi:MAG: hypothetical protein LC808_18945, partial [Actinobacteria bacterium]|nr:hypothetical protein [Actinomycetota bacterium]
MARSIRVFHDNQQGRVRKNFNWAPINKKSAVIITAAEFHRPGGLGGLEDLRPFLGAANIWVSNVGVHGPEGGAGGVEFHLHVDWDSPLNVMSLSRSSMTSS